jgi:hypothetical protein
MRNYPSPNWYSVEMDDGSTMYCHSGEPDANLWRDDDGWKVNTGLKNEVYNMGHFPDEDAAMVHAETVMEAVYLHDNAHQLTTIANGDWTEELQEEYDAAQLEWVEYAEANAEDLTAITDSCIAEEVASVLANRQMIVEPSIEEPMLEAPSLDRKTDNNMRMGY